MSSSLETLSNTQLNTRKLFLEEQLFLVIEAIQRKDTSFNIEVHFEQCPKNTKKIKIKKNIMNDQKYTNKLNIIRREL
jgi:hypothetical protein